MWRVFAFGDMPVKFGVARSALQVPLGSEQELLHFVRSSHQAQRVEFSGAVGVRWNELLCNCVISIPGDPPLIYQVLQRAPQA